MEVRFWEMPPLSRVGISTGQAGHEVAVRVVAGQRLEGDGGRVLVLVGSGQKRRRHRRGLPITQSQDLLGGLGTGRR